MDARLIEVAEWFSKHKCGCVLAPPCEECMDDAKQVIALVKSFDPPPSLGIYCGEDIGQKM